MATTGTSTDLAGGSQDAASGGANGGNARRHDTKGYIPPAGDGPPSAANDPLDQYRAIFKDADLSDEQKDWLIDRAQRRFQNRRRMAYMALIALLAVLAVVLGGAVLDGVTDSTIIAHLQDAANLLGVTSTLLTSIVGAYYGFSSFRPSS